MKQGGRLGGVECFEPFRTETLSGICCDAGQVWHQSGRGGLAEELNERLPVRGLEEGLPETVVFGWLLDALGVLVFGLLCCGCFFWCQATKDLKRIFESMNSL